MIAASNRLSAAAGHQAAVEARCEAPPPRVGEAPGCLRREVRQPVADGGALWSAAPWADEACFQAWTASAACARRMPNAGRRIWLPSPGRWRSTRCVVARRDEGVMA